MEDNIIEVRFTELKASSVNPNNRVITGTAVVFGSISEPLGEKGDYREVIQAGAITQELIDQSDVKCLWNHNTNSGILARWNKGKGTLKIILYPERIDISFTAKKTALGDEILEGIRCGDITAMSFAFRKSQGGDYYKRQADGSILRVITSIDLFNDVSFVSEPAYTATKCDLRGLDEFKLNEIDMEANTNKCDGCDKCDLIIAQNEKLIEMVQGMIIEDVVEDLTETLEPVEVEPTVEPVVVDETPTTEMRNQEQIDVELSNYYIDLKNNIKSIKIK